jgi:hypothetical protein
MRIPKLKYFYLALTQSEYDAFEKTRVVVVDSATTIDIITGEIRGVTVRYLSDTARACDDEYRHRMRYTKPLYILRIPADHIDRTRLEISVSQFRSWLYRQPIQCEHCGVERFEIAPQPS